MAGQFQPRQYKARAILAGGLALALAILAGSGGLARFDALLVACTFACLFATFGIACIAMRYGCGGQAREAELAPTQEAP